AKAPILLVEREPKTRRVLKVSLDQAGYETLVARDGNEALKQLEHAAPVLLIAATDLSKLDGYGLVRRMKSDPRWARIPVLFMIAGGQIEDKIRGLELGVDEYLSKPVFVKELLGRVEVLLARRMRENLSESAAQTRVAGSLSDMPPVDLFESLESGAQSGIVRLTSGEHEGAVFFHNGEIVNAQLKRLRGEEAVFRMLCWTTGRFEVELAPVHVERIVEGKTRAV